MQAKTHQVRAAFAQCEAWYSHYGENIRQFSERTEALWFQVDDLSYALQEAERRGNRGEVTRHIQSLLRYVLAIQAEVQATRSQRSEN